MFNHESPRRGETFVSRKITLGAVGIAAGIQEKLILGNLDSKRDWGCAKDFVEGMWLMLQQEKPEDYVLATGRTMKVREFVELAFQQVGIPIYWIGKGLDEKGLDADGRVLVEVSPQFFRPSEVDLLIGDASKARKELGWIPKTSVEELVKMMVDHDRKFVDKGLAFAEKD